ncbi:MAG: RNA polymerase sigma-70 factor [Longimicrobiales bacterium]
MDRAWAERIRAGDEAAYESLFREYYVKLCTHANSILAAPDIAEEIVQDVFVKLWRNRGTWEVRTSVGAYLYTAVRNGALNHVHRRRTEERVYQEAARDAGARRAMFAPSAAERMESEQIADEVRRAIERLPARCRQVVILRWQHQLKHAEIAEVLGISIKGVENHLARGMQALRKDLGARLPT